MNLSGPARRPHAGLPKTHDFLTGISERLASPPAWLIERISLLSRLQIGVSDDPIFKLPGVLPRTLGAGSLVGAEGLSATSCAFVLASGLQQLRHDVDPVKRLESRFPDNNVFGVRNLENYSESMLQALLFRLVRPFEWGDENRTQLQARVGEFVNNEQQNILLGELILAGARGVLPPFGPRFFRNRFQPYLGDICEAFEQALHISR